MAGEQVVDLSVSQRQVLINVLVTLLGNFLPLLGDDPHDLLSVEVGLLGLDHFATLLREEQVGTQGFSRWFSVLLDLTLLIFEVQGEEVPVLPVPEVPLGALLEWLKLKLGCLKVTGFARV